MTTYIVSGKSSNGVYMNGRCRKILSVTSVPLTAEEISAKTGITLTSTKVELQYLIKQGFLKEENI